MEYHHNILGITGNVGAGKSFISSIFQEKGIPVYDVDFHSRDIMNHDANVVQGIIDEFGEGVYENGVLKRKELGKIVFNDKPKLLYLEHLVHPAIKESFAIWMDGLQDNEDRLVAQENAILFEKNQQNAVDFILTVTCPTQERLKRVMERDNMPEVDVKSRFKNQMTQVEKARLSDFVIVNHNKSKEQLSSEVDCVISSLRYR